LEVHEEEEERTEQEAIEVWVDHKREKGTTCKVPKTVA
jgi:hypothetical protein